jgi:hypothetical protein
VLPVLLDDEGLGVGLALRLSVGLADGLVPWEGDIVTVGVSDGLGELETVPVAVCEGLGDSETVAVGVADADAALMVIVSVCWSTPTTLRAVTKNV